MLNCIKQYLYDSICDVLEDNGLISDGDIPDANGHEQVMYELHAKAFSRVYSAIKNDFNIDICTRDIADKDSTDALESTESKSRSRRRRRTRR